MRSGAEKVFLAVLWIISVMMGSLALADWEPDTYTFQIVEKTKAEPVYMPGYDVIVEHEIDDADVAVLSKLLWSSPLTNETYKRQLCWIVLNRVTDQSGLFPNSIQEVVTKTPRRRQRPPPSSKQNRKIAPRLSICSASGFLL